MFKENPTYIEEAHKLGLKVNAWTVNDPVIMQQMMDAGVDFITTDKPLIITEMVKNNQKSNNRKNQRNGRKRN